MPGQEQSAALLRVEARGLLARLDQLEPLALRETMVPAAALSPRASLTMERFLHGGRTLLRRQVRAYIRWLDGPGSESSAEERQRRFVQIRMRFNAILSQLDLFAEVVTQRSESQTGVWLSGLDVLATDSLTANSQVEDPPALVCFLARGPGAAIRRARTRLPGGELNPIGIIRVPRERMVGQGVASSLVHEVGHQGAALLGLVDSLRADISATRREVGPRQAPAWINWERWISEIVADFWSVAVLGISSTMGLLAVVSLPQYFVFRPSGDDPHPIPYLRVLISCAIGEALHPHPQWADMAASWKAMYPLARLPEGRQAEFRLLEEQIPGLVSLLAGHTSPALGNRPLATTFPLPERAPRRLEALAGAWRGDLGHMARQPPSLVLAVIGQARAAGRLAPESESQLLSNLLRVWALRSTLALTPDHHQPDRRPLVRAS